VVKLRHDLGGFGLALFYLLAAIGAGVFGRYLQSIAFTSPPSAGQMYAAVFVRDPAAHVSLQAEVYPDKPWTDSLTVTLSDISPKQPGWLLVIECPAGAPSQSRAVHLTSETVPQTQSPFTWVTVYSGLTNPRPGTRFHCFLSSGYPPSLANVSLPALQIDQEMVSAQAAPVLYAQQNRPGSTVRQLLQVFPGAVCPSATPTPVPTTSSSGIAPAPSSVTAIPPLSGGSTAPASLSSPSSSPQTTTPANPGCLNLAPAGTKFIPYELPASVTTIETLHHVNTKGYQISMFPVGSTNVEKSKQPGQTAEESIIWSARSGLNPSLDATNHAAESAANHDIFVAGIFFGLATGAAVEFVDRLWAAFRDKKRKRSNIGIVL